MTNAELEKLYKQIENDLDNLKAGTTKQYEAPYFTEHQLIAIPKIIKHLKDNKYGNEIDVKEFPMRTKVTKLQAQETSVFSNPVFEKSEQQIEAEQAYNKCVAGKHKLTMTDKTTFKNPLLVCQQCNLGYTFKLNSATQQVARVIQL